MSFLWVGMRVISFVSWLSSGNCVLAYVQSIKLICLTLKMGKKKRIAWISDQDTHKKERKKESIISVSPSINWDCIHLYSRILYAIEKYILISDSRKSVFKNICIFTYLKREKKHPRRLWSIVYFFCRNIRLVFWHIGQFWCYWPVIFVYFFSNKFNWKHRVE